MARRNWMPRSISARVILLAHLDENLKYYKDDLNISDDALERVHKSHLIFAYMFKNQHNLIGFLKAWNYIFNALNEGKKGIPLDQLPKLSDFGLEPEMVPSNIFRFIRDLRSKLIHHPNYSESIGLALWFYGAEINFKKDAYKPTLKVVVNGNKIKVITSTIDVKLHQIDLKVGKSKGFTYFNKFTRASFEFTIPINTKNVGIPVSIQLIGIVKDKIIGEYSDAKEILYRSDGK